MLASLDRAGAWFLSSGIQQPNGAVARHYRADIDRNSAVSTEITAYAASAFTLLHELSGDSCYLDRAAAARRFLAAEAWDAKLGVMPFEVAPAEFTYFFDCGIVVRGLLTGGKERLETALAVGCAMARDFAAEDGGYEPVLALPGKVRLEHDPLRWSRAPGCYQLKSAMAWWDLYEVTGGEHFRDRYRGALEQALCRASEFLPGHTDREKVMDRIHAWIYFLEGLLPAARDPRCAAALEAGIRRAAELRREIAPLFERSDVCAQILRIRMHAEAAGAAPLDRDAAREEAETLVTFQRPDGGFYFGRKRGEWLPHVSPVSTAFAIEALALWNGMAPRRERLI